MLGWSSPQQGGQVHVVTPCYSWLLLLLGGKTLWAACVAGNAAVILQVGQSSASPWSSPQLPEGSCGFPSLLYSVSFSCLFRSCSLSPQLSHKSNCSLCTCIFEFAHGRWRFQCPVSPPSRTTFTSNSLRCNVRLFEVSLVY